MRQKVVIPARCAPPNLGSRPFNGSCKPYLNLDSRFTVRCPGMTRRGFTLIELLVVVLIIGILSAVALPQYYKAVAKSRFAGLLSLAAVIGQAEERYYMANGDYTDDPSNLDVTLPGGFTETFLGEHQGRVYRNGQRKVVFYQEGNGGHARISLWDDRVPAFILWGFDPSVYRWCGVVKGIKEEEVGKSICSTYGSLISDGDLFAYYHLQ